MNIQNELCSYCWGSGESQHSPDMPCVKCKSLGVEKVKNANCAWCNTEIDNAVEIEGVNRYCSNECYDEHTERWG